MKMFRQILAALLACTILVSGMSSCGGKKQSPDSSSSSTFDMDFDPDTSSEGGTDGEDISGGDTSGGAVSSGDKVNTSSASGSTASGSDTGKVLDLKGREIKWNVLNATNSNTPEGKRKLENYAALEKKYNCKIKEIAKISESAGNTEITTSVLSGAPAVDMWFHNGASEIFTHYRASLLQNVSDMGVFNFSDPNSPFPTDQEIFNFGGQYYGVVDRAVPSGDPWAALVVFFNDKLLRANGINDDLFALQNSNGWTWEKFKEICDKFNTNNRDPNITACYDGTAQLYQALLHTRGTDWVSMDKSKNLSFTGGTAAAQEALSYYQSLIGAGTVKIGSSANSFTAGGGAFDGDTANANKYSFAKGLSAFTVFSMLGMEWHINKNSLTTADVKKNFGVLYLPKVKQSDAYTFVSPISNTGGYAIPKGVRRPNEVATIINEIINRQPEDSAAAKSRLMAQYVEPWLNTVTGTGTKATANGIIDSFFSRKFSLTYNGLSANTTPNIASGDDGWMSHVYKISTGTEAMGSVLTSVTGTYNDALSKLHSQR